MYFYRSNSGIVLTIDSEISVCVRIVALNRGTLLTLLIWRAHSKPINFSAKVLRSYRLEIGAFIDLAHQDSVVLRVIISSTIWQLLFKHG